VWDLTHSEHTIASTCSCHDLSQAGWLDHPDCAVYRTLSSGCQPGGECRHGGIATIRFSPACSGSRLPGRGMRQGGCITPVLLFPRKMLPAVAP